MRVLLSAYACEPDKGSEPADGWMWARQIARFHDVWVITRKNNREAIEASLEKEPLPNVHWMYFDLPLWARFWKKKQRGVHVYYFLWQIGVYFVGRRLHRHISLDLIHHVTFGQYWMPSFLALLPVPFVWGPVGGGESAPTSFWRDFSARGKRFEVLRSVARSLALINPIMFAIARRSKAAIATTGETALRLKRLGATRVEVHPQFGMTEAEMQHFGSFPIRQSSPFRLISMGRLIHWKGFHLSLRAFAEFHAAYPESEYWIVSSGPEANHLKAMAKQLGIQESVVFWGHLGTLQDVYDKLAQCDVLVHPALHEAFGNACLEALAAGRPVICLDLGGPALQVSADTGIKVPAISPQQSVKDLAAAFLRLASDTKLRLQMAQAARDRVHEHFDWQQKGEWMDRIYRDGSNGRHQVIKQQSSVAVSSAGAHDS